MTLVVAIEGVVIVLLLILVAGLLKSHAEILRQLDSLSRGMDTPPVDRPRSTGLGAAPRMNLTGVDPSGVSISLSLASGSSETLIAFLSTGCASCQVFWRELGRDPSVARMAARTVIVTKGTEHESPSKVNAVAPSSIPLVMSDEVWDDFRVPLTPYFALVAHDSRILGEGSATTLDRLIDLFSQSAADSQPISMTTKERADTIDTSLRRSGVEPGDPSLYEDPLNR